MTHIARATLADIPAIRSMAEVVFPATYRDILSQEQIADMINRQRLHLRKDGQPVTSRQVYAVVCRYPDMFVKAEGRIMLMI